MTHLPQVKSICINAGEFVLLLLLNCILYTTPYFIVPNFDGKNPFGRDADYPAKQRDSLRHSVAGKPAKPIQSEHCNSSLQVHMLFRRHDHVTLLNRGKRIHAISLSLRHDNDRHDSPSPDSTANNLFTTPNVLVPHHNHTHLVYSCHIYSCYHACDHPTKAFYHSQKQGMPVSQV